MAPDDSSGQELQAVITYKNNKSTGPDTVDVGPSFASEGIAEGLWDPYRNSHWNSIPDAMKDPKGYWVGDYYGVEAFAVNTTMVKNVPQDWADLLKPEYKNTIGINGDTRSSNDAFMAVWAAALANGGSLDNILPGIEFLAKLKKKRKLSCCTGFVRYDSKSDDSHCDHVGLLAIRISGVLSWQSSPDHFDSQNRGTGRVLLPGRQQICSASVCWAFVGGVPVFGRRAAGMA